MFRNLVTWSWSVGKIILIGVVVACSVVHGLNLEENLDETSLTAETPCCAKILPKSTDDRSTRLPLAF